MNFEQIESVWRSPHNQPSATKLEKLKMNIVAELNRRHRASRGLLGLTALPLLFITYKIARHVLSADPTLTPVNWEREWALLPFLTLPWLGWFVMLRLYLRHQRRHPNYEGSIRASVAASLDENRTERMRYGVLGWSHSRARRKTSFQTTPMGRLMSLSSTDISDRRYRQRRHGRWLGNQSLQ